MWRRRLFTLCSAVSLLLCVAACVLWARSYWVGDHWAWQYGYQNGAAAVTRGQVSLFTLSGTLHGPYPGASPRWVSPGRLTYHAVRPPQPRAGRFARSQGDLYFALGDWMVSYGRGAPVPPYYNWYRMVVLRLPVGAFAVPFAVLPAWWAGLAMRQRRRARRGLCLRCGYDLRASPERCPECGAGGEGVGAVG